jgi:hypothetical protein
MSRTNLNVVIAAPGQGQPDEGATKRPRLAASGSVNLSQSRASLAGLRANGVHRETPTPTSGRREDQKSQTDNGTRPDSICCLPLIAGGSDCLGVVEIAHQNELTPGDMDLVNSFVAITTRALEKINLPQLAALGYAELKALNWMTVEEAVAFAIPQKLMLQDDVFSPTFPFENYDGIDLFKVIFKIFERFSFLQLYKISAERLFGFLVKVMSMYEKTVYTWRHAVDVTQFLSMEIVSGKLDTSYVNGLELFGMIVAALCHDLRHDTFVPFSDPLAIPQTLILRLPGALEGDNLLAALEAFSDPEANIFWLLGQKEIQSIWTLIVKLILATDMRCHFQLMREVQVLMESDELNVTGDHDHRLLVLKMLFKCADCAYIFRAFSTSKPWSVDDAREFFRTGDLRGARDFVFTTDQPSPEGVDEEACLIPFFINICVPLAQLVARVVPGLKGLPTVAKENIQKWARRTQRPVPSFEWDRGK